MRRGGSRRTSPSCRGYCASLVKQHFCLLRFRSLRSLGLLPARANFWPERATPIYLGYRRKCLPCECTLVPQCDCRCFRTSRHHDSKSLPIPFVVDSFGWGHRRPVNRPTTSVVHGFGSSAPRTHTERVTAPGIAISTQRQGPFIYKLRGEHRQAAGAVTAQDLMRRLHYNHEGGVGRASTPRCNRHNLGFFLLPWPHG
jgi:hypothetical protein